MYTSNVKIYVDNYTKSKPVTYDYLRPNGFRFTIKEMPQVAYTCQSANIPSLQLGNAVQPTPFVDLPVIGDKIVYGEFTIRFLIQEDMTNYNELLGWLIALGFPKDYKQYSSFIKDKETKFPFYTSERYKDNLAYSDSTLTILDSTNNPKTNIIFYDSFPISLESLDYDVTSTEVPFMVGISSFKYAYFEIKPV